MLVAEEVMQRLEIQPALEARDRQQRLQFRREVQRVARAASSTAASSPSGRAQAARSAAGCPRRRRRTCRRCAGEEPRRAPPTDAAALRCRFCVRRRWPRRASAVRASGKLYSSPFCAAVTRAVLVGERLASARDVDDAQARVRRSRSRRPEMMWPSSGPRCRSVSSIASTTRAIRRRRTRRRCRT